MAQLVEVAIKELRDAGVEVLPRGNSRYVRLPVGTVLEPPCSLKWLEVHHSYTLSAFSYHVSGYSFASQIGRYCSFGENVQIGRQNHPMTWASTSPALYEHEPIFAVGQNFEASQAWHNYRPEQHACPTHAKKTVIGDDVWIGHNAFICPGVNIGTGAVVAAHAVVTKDVPSYALVAGNPASIKKLRIPEKLISPMLKSEWWRYAPWQLTSCNPSNPAEFVHNVMHMEKRSAYLPKRLMVTETGTLI